MPESTPQNNATLRKTRCRTTQTPRTTSAGCPSFAFGRSGRSGEIRTRGLTVPNRTRYQTALHPEIGIQPTMIISCFVVPTLCLVARSAHRRFCCRTDRKSAGIISRCQPFCRRTLMQPKLRYTPNQHSADLMLNYISNIPSDCQEKE